MSKTKNTFVWKQVSTQKIEKFFEIGARKGGPPSKPKYILLIDSEQVPWGKGEKEP